MSSKVHKRMVAEFDAAILPYTSKIDAMTRDTERFRSTSERGFADVDKAANRSTVSLRSLYAAGAALGGSVILYQMKQFTDTAKQMDNQMRAIGAGADETQKKIYALAIQTRTPIESTVGLLRSMQKSLKDQDLNTTIRQVGTLNRLLTIGGLDSAARGSVALQFGQALQSGVLAGDELRALREAAPIELLEAIAEAAGGTVEGLRALGSQGKLTRDVMVQALEDLEGESIRKFDNFKMTLSEASEALRTAIVASSGAFDEGLGVTERIAAAQQAVAKYMLDNTDAAKQLGEALKIILDVSLVLAGTRGLLYLGQSTAAVGAKFVALQSKIGGTALAMRGLTGAMSIFGGPWGLALFAAGTAFTMLKNQAVSFSDAMGNIDGALKELDKLPSKYDEISKEITGDLEKLEGAQDKLKTAIESQGEAARLAADSEVQAIERRLTKNRELLELHIEIARNNMVGAQQGLADMRANLFDPDMLRQIGRDRMREANETGDRSALNSPITDTTKDDYLRAKMERTIATEAEARTKAQNEFLVQYRAYVEAKDKIAAEEARLNAFITVSRNENSDELTGDAAIAEAATKKMMEAKEQSAKADAELLEAYDANTKKLSELQERRTAAFKQLQGAVADGNNSLAGSWLGVLSEIDRKIEATSKNMSTPQERLAVMVAEVSRLRELVNALPVDESGQARAALADMEAKLADAKAEGSDLDNLSLGGLKGEFEGVLSVVNTLLSSMGLLGESADDISRKTMSVHDMRGQYHTTRAHSDRVTNARNETDAAKSGILGLIGYAEGTDKGRGYNETLDYGKWTGGDKNLISMTLNEVLKLGDSMRTQENRDTYAGGGSSALGRYQIVGTTMRGLIKEMGLSGNELYSPDMQDRMAMQLVRRRQGQGPEGYRNEWQGLNRVSDGSINEALGTQSISRMDSGVADSLEEEIQKRKEALEVRKAFTESATEEAAIRQANIDMMGKSASEQAYLTTKMGLLSKAKRENIDLDERMTNSTLTYGQQIEILSRQAEDDMRIQEQRADALENVKERTDFLAEANNQLKEGLLDAIIEGDNFADVLGNVAKMLARAALEAALFNTGPFQNSTSGGQGLLGGIFSNLFSGLFGGITASANGNIVSSAGAAPLQMRAYSNGGIATSPQLSLFGEGDTPEAYVPLPDGRTIPVTMSMPNLGAISDGSRGGGGSQTLQVHIHENAAKGEHKVEYSREDNRLDVRLKEMTSDMLENGELDKPMARRFGMKPKPMGG